MRIFEYGEEEIAALKKRDKALSGVIDHIGRVERPITPDLFAALVSSIIAQQISGKAADTVRRRLNELAGGMTPQALGALQEEDIQRCGMSMRKASYIKNIAQTVLNGGLDMEALAAMRDEEVLACLCALNGIGKWTAEMLMLFSMQRPDILSYDDLAIHRGLRMIYHHRKITRELFEKYRRRYSPYGSVASLYIYAVAGGAYGYQDYAPLTDAQKRKKRKAAAQDRVLADNER